MSWMVSVAVVATMVSLVHSDAGHFFAETPKHLPRIGRRGDLPPLVNLLNEEDPRGTSGGGAPTGNSMTEALAKVDGDGDGCVSLPELLRIPMIRIAILLQDPALIAPHVDADAANESSDDYASDRRPEPRLLRYLK
ncbi:uncharacterized protein [Macrobrachium rosenbergii]|uniref:uncharacterized protein isoform X1 n=1 Tax=Macrobrachium rosenbergii TaxID=79674 RepID=UPI0034D3AD76